MIRALTVPALLALAAAALAAPISWSPATDTTGKSQLVEGTVVYAFSGGSAATITGGGAGGSQTYVFSGGSYQALAFTPTPGDRTSSNVSNNAPSTGDANFDTIIKSFTDTESGITVGTQTIGGLTNGTTYQIQVFFNDQRSAATRSRVMTYGDGEDSPGTVDISADGANWGQFAVGTFTADAATQDLTHATNGFGNVHLNAILVTEPAGPPQAPEVPTNLTATGGNEIVILDWDDNSQFGFSNFIVRRSETEGGPYTDIATPTSSNFTDTGLTNGTPYYYVVAAKNSLDQVSDDSDEASATPEIVPEPPNFLFIITDDQDTYSINAYRTTEPAEMTAVGQPYVVDTPNIDRLAAEGMLFHQARLMGSQSGAVCSPSRTMIMSGKNNGSADIRRHRRHHLPRHLQPRRAQRPGGPPHATYRTCKSGNSYSVAKRRVHHPQRRNQARQHRQQRQRVAHQPRRRLHRALAHQAPAGR
jgi:hypothetical protein